MIDFRIGHGYDVHRFEKGLELWLGGVKIEHEYGLLAHSDGDVVLHALCDALLGAAALGDIGQHFPDTLDEFKGIDSKILLRKTVELIQANGYEVGNVDCTVCLELPKLKPYIDLMRETIAKAMGVAVAVVSVKATTTEKLGFVGRQEGVESHSVVMIYKR